MIPLNGESDGAIIVIAPRRIQDHAQIVNTVMGKRTVRSMDLETKARIGHHHVFHGRMMRFRVRTNPRLMAALNIDAINLDETAIHNIHADVGLRPDQRILANPVPGDPHRGS